MERRHIWCAFSLAVLCSLTLLSSCQSTAVRTSVSTWPSSDLKQLATVIHLPSQPRQVTWQAISLPVHNDARSVPGPTDMVGVAAILTFDAPILETIIEDSAPFAGGEEKPGIFRAFIFNWYPQAVREHIVASESPSATVTLQGYDAHLFLKSPDDNIRGSFFTRIPGESSLFLYYQHWLNVSDGQVHVAAIAPVLV